MTTKNSPINFRMPTALRARLRKFAEERNLGEAEALRLAVSERLNQAEDERTLLAAERWQFEQAYATWQRLNAGTEEILPEGEIERVFDRALKQKRPRARARARK